MEENKISLNHKIGLVNRKTGSITGVKDVISFDVASVLLETSQGMLTIKGTDLHVSRLNLDKGEVDIDGQIDSLTYSDINSYARRGESILSRMFK